MGNNHYPPNSSQVAALPGRFAPRPAPPVATVSLSTTSPNWGHDDAGRRHHSFDTPRNRAVPSLPALSSTKKTSLVKRFINHFNNSANHLSMRSESRLDNLDEGFDRTGNGAFYLPESKIDTLVEVLASSITNSTQSPGSAIHHKELPLPPPRAPTAPPMFGTFDTERPLPVDGGTARKGMSLGLSLVSSTVSCPVLRSQLSDKPSLGNRALGKDASPTETIPFSSIPRSFGTRLQETQGTEQTIVAAGTIRVLDQTLRQSAQHFQQNQCLRSQSVPYTEFHFNPVSGQTPNLITYHTNNKRSSALYPSNNSATSSPVSPPSTTYGSSDIPKRKKLPPSQPSKLQQQQQHHPQQQPQQHQQPQQDQRPSNSRRQSQLNQAPVYQELENRNILLESELISERQRSANLQNENSNLQSQNTDFQNQIDDLRDLLDELNQRQELANHGFGAAAGNFLQGSEVRQRWKTLGWKIRQFIHAVSSGTEIGDHHGGVEDYEGSADGGGGGGADDGNGGSSRWGQLSSEQAVLGRQQQQKQSRQGPGVQSSSKTPTTNANDILRSITPHYRTLLAMKDGRQLLAEAAIWSLLVTEVFGTKETASWMHWAGTLSGNFRVMVAEGFQRGHHRNSKEFHRWRCHTASFLATLPSEGDVRAHAELVVQSLEHTLWYTLTGGGGGGGGGGTTGTGNKSKASRGGGSSGGKAGNLNNLRSGLLEIVLSAIQFDKELCQQQAFWYCQYPTSTTGRDKNGTTRFDPQQMETLNGDSKSVGSGAVVTLMVSPMLVKAGDSYGKGYGVSETIEKSVVHVVSKYWEDNGYSTSPSPSPAPTSSRSRGRGMSLTGTAPETTSAMVVYRAPSTRPGRSGHASRPATTEKIKEGKKGKGKKLWGGLKRRTASKVTRSDMYDN
ncbi:hypothetical protein QBC32DRAFT_97342 [Pseudoneurospora amorphoporcata]|uniref:Uncharacterized protein n=1 Tax=Pseudoneurospora amorphoporcata TaxID=241081 RepID=A0AAN6NY06_9PEZI|nr:hypothetical protein QBC32DRAFT_97342 [Pseudoneurospora amorphoporcata]